MFHKQVAASAALDAAKMAKSTIVQGESLFAGLNCFEPGQEHSAHTHAGQDKLYVVLQGSGDVQVGEQRERLSAGDVAFAPAGVMHAIHNPGPERLVVMAVLAPPPPSK